MRRKTVHRRMVRAGLLFGNVAILAGLLLFVVQNQHTSATGKDVHSVTSLPTAAANPLDQLSSATIAASVAQLNNLPETTAVVNQAQSEVVQLTAENTNSNLVAKPQVVATALKSKSDIKSYIAVAGDTVTSIATKFNVTSNSIRWSNSLAGDIVAAGTKLAIPPVNGIVYVVKNGDTPESLAQRYNAEKDQIIVYNDAEINGLNPGEQIIIPNGSITPVAAPVPVVSSTLAYAGTFNAIYAGSNGYDYGYCTWYVATQIAVPSNWGNANTWAYYAAVSGWTVSRTPVVGAVAQTSAGYFGHVAIVEAISEDGSQIKYSDMNSGYQNWNVVRHHDWTPVSRFEHYIYN